MRGQEQLWSDQRERRSLALPKEFTSGAAVAAIVSGGDQEYGDGGKGDSGRGTILLQTWDICHFKQWDDRNCFYYCSSVPSSIGQKSALLLLLVRSESRSLAGTGI